MKRELTCIYCPLGCRITAEIENGKILSVRGFMCKRGKEYAETECTNPVRVVTSTVKTADGEPVPVKTDRAIPKSEIFECMKIINGIEAKKPIKIGDVLKENVFGSNIVATGNSE